MHRNSILNLFLIIVIAGMLSGKTLAYDNDVDFSAPYLTVDPETGILVTVDPRQGTVTPHSTSKGDVTSSSEQSTMPDSAAEDPSYSLHRFAAVSGILVIVLGGAFFLRKLK